MTNQVTIETHASGRSHYKDIVTGAIEQFVDNVGSDMSMSYKAACEIKNETVENLLKQWDEKNALTTVTATLHPDDPDPVAAFENVRASILDMRGHIQSPLQEDKSPKELVYGEGVNEALTAFINPTTHPNKTKEQITEIIDDLKTKLLAIVEPEMVKRTKAKPTEVHEVAFGESFFLAPTCHLSRYRLTEVYYTIHGCKHKWLLDTPIHLLNLPKETNRQCGRIVFDAMCEFTVVTNENGTTAVNAAITNQKNELMPIELVSFIMTVN